MANASNKKQGIVVALTGASNYLGIGFMKNLVKSGKVAKIVAIDTIEPSFEHDLIAYYKVDLTSPSSQQTMANIFKNEGVTHFFHLIFTYTLSRHRALAHELEAIGTLHVLDACAAANVKRIVARSTTAIYGAKAGNPNFLTENHKLHNHKQDSFLSDKVELERQMRIFGDEHPDCKVAILRDCTSLGATSINYLSSILLAKRSPRIFGFDPLMQFIHEEDLFRAYFEMCFNDAEGIFNIVGKGVVRYSEAIRQIAGCQLLLPETVARSLTAVLWNLKLYDIPSTFINHIKYSWVADGTKAAKELGFVPKHDCFQALEEVSRSRFEQAS